ncbi:MAG: family 43 glycosylhydrolase [Candidatus Eisenbacteria bacterium]|nr:family 43 glycosylhydrolase [Candidatus Eisenbacteria bacterium]
MTRESKISARLATFLRGRTVLLAALCYGCCLSVALLNSPCVSAALLKIDFDQRYLHEPGWVIKDHAFIKVDSVYHVFYQRGPDYSSSRLAVDSIGHATSLDMKHWNIHPPVLAVQSHTWENAAVWAPFVMENPAGGYIMYYTGVDSNEVERIGAATSEDLFTWTKYAGNPIFRPDTAWSAWDSTVQYSSCRDPYVYCEDGTYYLLVTAHANDGSGVVASAISTDLFNWTDNGPIYTHSGTDRWHAIESCFLIKRNDTYRLFFSEQDSPPGTSYMASDSLYSGWDISARRVVDSGIAPEILNGDGVELFSRFSKFLKGDTVNTAVKIDTLRWDDDLPNTEGPHPLAEHWYDISGEALYYQPAFGDNSWQRGGEHCGYIGNSWLGTMEYFQGPLQAGWSGWALGEDARGSAKSYPFTIQADSISLLVGGGNHPDSAFVALYRASDDSLLFSETGRNSDTMDRRVWLVRSLKGESVYLKIVDDASGYFGHINCDEIAEFFAQPDVTPPWVSLFEPSGAETLVQGEQFEIRWKAGDETAIDSVVLEYSLDGGSTFPYLIARPSPQDTSYLWNIPQTYSDSCLVRATVYDWGPNSTSDQSDSLFRIVAYIGVDENPSNAPAIERKLALSVQGQNPFAERTSFRFNLPSSFAGRRFSLDVFDTAGRHVRDLTRGTCPANGAALSAPWNACDESGRLVGSGIYFVLLRVDGTPLLTKKIVLLK